jgi:hypothetical protein
MAHGNQVIKHKLTGGVLLFTASFLLYCLAGPGNIPGDSEIRWSVSRQIVRNATVAIEDTVAEWEYANYAVGADGRRYSFYGLGQSICLLPLAAMGLLLEKLTHLNPEPVDLAMQFLVSAVLFPAVGALTVWLMYHLVILLGYNKKVSLLTAAVLAFATMHFHYSVNTQEQTQVELLLVLAMIFMVRNQRQPRFVYAWLLCVTLGLCLLFRLDSLVLILPIYLTAAGAEILAQGKLSKIRRAAKWLAAGICGTGWVIVLTAWYNYIRFGSALESGYHLCPFTKLAGYGLFEAPPLPTIAAMLFSPGKSIFLYNPVLLLLPLCVFGFYQRHKAVALAAFFATAGIFILHSFHTTWAGDYAWSIRYQVPALPFLILPLAFLFNRTMKTVMRTLVASLISISCVIQLASVAYNFNLEYVQNPNHCIIPDGYVWDWSQSHLRMRFENIIRHMADKRDFRPMKVTDVKPILMKYNTSEETVRNTYNVNFFPFKAKSKLPSTKLFYLLLCLWLALLASFCAAIFKLVQFYMRQEQHLNSKGPSLS